MRASVHAVVRANGVSGWMSTMQDQSGLEKVRVGRQTHLRLDRGGQPRGEGRQRR